jgi:hypothetical protein
MRGRIVQGQEVERTKALHRVRLDALIQREVAFAIHYSYSPR